MYSSGGLPPNDENSLPESESYMTSADRSTVAQSGLLNSSQDGSTLSKLRGRTPFDNLAVWCVVFVGLECMVTISRWLRIDEKLDE